MRNYWLRIAMGAAGIFVVGMLVWSMIQRGRHAMKRVVESDEPITIPLALIPFTVDGRSIGTLRQVQIIRSEPEKVKAVNFRVKLADSVGDDRIGACVLVVGGSLEHVDAQHAFQCVNAGDTVGADLAPVGQVRTQRGQTYVLFAKAGALDSVKFDFGAHEAMREAERARVDSIGEAEQERADSIRDAANERADSIEQAARAMSDSIRAHVDSAIAASRPQIEEARRLRARTKAPAGPAAPAPPATPKP